MVRAERRAALDRHLGRPGREGVRGELTLHVALNAIQLVPGATGGLEVYARGLIPALVELEGLELTVIASNRAADELGKTLEANVIGVGVDAQSRVRAVLAEQTLLPRAVRRARPDLVHNLFNTAPVRPGAPQVTTIHDLIHRAMPETHAGVLGLGLRVLVSLAARRSRRIIAVSEATKHEVASRLGVEPERIDVVPNGPGTPPGPALPEPEVRRHLELGDRPVVLAVSAKRPHKNLERLIGAMKRVEDAVLVLPGYPTTFEPELRALAVRKGLAEQVRFTGWIDEPVLEGLYAVARCVVLPSLAEGFGMPVLEAMARGTPVACSDIPPLREVAGDAALYFDPLDESSIAAAIASLLADDVLRRRLADAGRERAALFTWERAARATVETYERALA